MLPAIMYSGNEQKRALGNKVLNALEEYLDVLTVTGSLREAMRFSKEEKGNLLFVADIGQDKQKEEELSLVRDVCVAHRDCYVVAMLSSLDDLQRVMEQAIKLSGILLPPLKGSQLVETLKRIIRDYRQNNVAAGDENVLVAHSGGTAIRIPHSSILYVEAQSKKLDIWTRRKCVSIYQSMESIQQELGESFMRCHRSYLVNRDAIQEVNFTDMVITLLDGIEIPFSRSNKAALRSFVDG